ncbi:MAG: response regulator [Rhodospirillales bacterium]|nr:response regulator [Rhodospirillales bacterium]MCW9001216.1 response regulator [Rhodospirillales bacterium]
MTSDNLPTTTPRGNAGPKAGARILVVEDEPVNRMIADGMLQQFGIEHDMAEDGAQAIALITNNRYSLIFMDVQMPDMNGYETTRRIRAWEKTEGRPKTPIVALTAYAAKGDRERCISAGMDDYMSKPIIRDAFLDKIEQWILPRSESPATKEAEPTTDESGGVLDAAAIAALREAMRSVPGGLEEVLNGYLESLDRLVVAMRDGSKADDDESIRRAAHSLKSNSAAVGALELSDLCRRLEVIAKDGSAKERESLIVGIAAQAEGVRAAVRTMLGV